MSRKKKEFTAEQVKSAKQLHVKYKDLSDDYLNLLRIKIYAGAIQGVLRHEIGKGDVLEQKLDDADSLALLGLSEMIGRYIDIRAAGLID